MTRYHLTEDHSQGGRDVGLSVQFAFMFLNHLLVYFKIKSKETINIISL